MHKYYIKELTPFSIKKNFLQKLKENFTYKEIVETLLLSPQGYYKVEDDKIQA